MSRLWRIRSQLLKYQKNRRSRGWKELYPVQGLLGSRLYAFASRIVTRVNENRFAPVGFPQTRPAGSWRGTREGELPE